jgi:hypothetical protein
MKTKFRVDVIFASDSFEKIFVFDTEADAEQFAATLKAANHSATVRRLLT